MSRAEPKIAASFAGTATEAQLAVAQELIDEYEALETRR